MARMHNPPHPGELIKASINELGITVTHGVNSVRSRCLHRAHAGHGG